MPTVNGQHEVTNPLWRVPLELFRFATTDELYLAVMQVFGDANDRLITALNLDEVLLACATWAGPNSLPTSGSRTCWPSSPSGG